MKNRKILGSGYAVGKEIVSNEDFEKILDTSDEWISSRTGIKTRRVSPDENSSDLGYRAALMAIEEANISKEDIDLIIVATITPDNITPSCASLIQDKLGLNEQTIMAFDMSAACTGFVYALQTASYMLSDYKCALVIGVDVNSKLMDYTDRNTSILFGDGAGAVIMKQENCNNVMYHYANSTGDHEGFLQGSGLVLPKPLQNGSREVGFLKQNGSEVFRFAVKALEEAVIEVLKKAGKDLDEIDYIIPHQANIRIIRNVAKRMKLSDDKFYTNLDKYGNTSGGSIPIALAEAMKENIIKPGMKIIMVGFGGGFTYAASYIEL
ncbi:beta-ketoacyl-ACP synthase III [Breznakia pachnodae]|uniref:Beta-ketoacyl-[acyl-carrier-protein] synthase III n=1 Tax=Breznakia pachnodae TaxID=265178 RepID=A0ABU0DYP5_9FIRM|nr:beta-ketoacyl-ACP synthase III [Breznakia pachnodae]MDQ0359758.1 3-oxoacyl-[acyl-carrier-protein] synthase-3 [Breznakia pachnodae]